MRIFFCLIVFFLLSLDGKTQTVYSLQEALKTAKANNPYLKSQGFNINIAESNVITSKLRPNPILNNQSLQLINSKYYPTGTEWSSNKNRQVWWQLTRPFQLPALRKSKIDVANQALMANQHAYGEVIRNFSFDAANQWLQAWVMESRLSLLQQAYSNLDSLVRINVARLRNQVITQTDLVRTQLLLQQYNLQLINTNKDFRNEIQKLKFIIGTTDSLDIDIKSPFEIISISSKLDSLLIIAAANRTDIKVAKTQIMLAESNIKLQKALVLPQPELGMIWNPQNTIPYLGFFGTIKLPILDRNQGEIEKSKYLKLQSEQNLQNVELQLRTEVEAAYRTYNTEKENLKKFENILNQSQQVLESVKYSYVKGGTTIIDFLDAQRSWFDIRQLYLNELLSYRQSYIRLLFVTGLINQL